MHSVHSPPTPRPARGGDALTTDNARPQPEREKGDARKANDPEALRASHLDRVVNNFKAALDAGASVTFTFSGTVATATVTCTEGTFTGHGENSVAALDKALSALPPPALPQSKLGNCA